MLCLKAAKSVTQAIAHDPSAQNNSCNVQVCAAVQLLSPMLGEHRLCKPLCIIFATFDTVYRNMCRLNTCHCQTARCLHAQPKLKHIQPLFAYYL